jgi:UDP-2,3-diacylglucosamine hydrolase
MTRKTIYFISDAHLGAPFKDAAQWERRLTEFFHSIADRAAALYILGDLFDFWIEYRHAIRTDYFLIVHELRKLIERGVEIHYFAGNHDFAFGPFITQTLGMTVHPGHERMVLQGRRVHLYHGDGLLGNDTGYRILKAMLRNRVYQAMYKLLPPAVGIGLAARVSGSSRKCGEKLMNEKIIAEYRSHARAYLEKGNDIVIFGHSHHAELSCWGDDKVYCNTGAWMRQYNFATMNEGKLRLWRYRGTAEPEEVSSLNWNKGNSAS